MSVRRLNAYSVASFIVFTSCHFLLHLPGYGLMENAGVACILFGMMMVVCGAFHLHGFLARYTNEGVTP